jgi:hemerythrin-like domain-containing protein
MGEGEVMSKLQSEYDLLRDYSRELEEEVASLKKDRMNFIHMNEKLQKDITLLKTDNRRYDVPVSPTFGITSVELGNYVRSFADYCASRVEHDGLREYDRGDHQAFEALTLQEIVVGTQEEIADAANYLAMVSLHIGRLSKTALFKDIE